MKPEDETRPLIAHEIPERPVLEVGNLLKDITPAVLAALGADLEVASWETTSRDSYGYSWPGEQLGPSTRVHTVAVFKADEPEAEAEITTNVIRWNPREVTFIEVGGSWKVGDLDVWCWGRGEKEEPLRKISIRAPKALESLVLEALRAPRR